MKNYILFPLSFLFAFVLSIFLCVSVPAQEKSLQKTLGAAWSNFHKGESAAGKGDLKAAETYFLAALATARKSTDKKSEAEIVSRLGNLFKDFGNKIKAAEYFTLLVKLKREAGSPLEEARAWVSLAAVIDSFEQARAEELYQKALAFFEANNALYEKALTLKNLGGDAIARRRFDKAEKYLTESLELMRKHGLPIDEIDGLRVLGVLKNAENKPALARPFFEQALAKLETNTDSRVEADTLSGFAKTEFFSGRFIIALRLFEKALAIYEKLGLMSIAADVLVPISSLHLTLGQNDLARQTGERARELGKQFNNPSQQALTANALGGVYWRTGDYPSAIKTFLFAIEKSRQAENFPYLALSYFNLGSIYHILGDYPRALENLQKSHELQEKHGSPFEQRAALLSIGQIFLQQDKLKEAKSKFEQILKLAKTDQDTQNQAFANQLLGVVAMRLKNPSEARLHFNSALTLYLQSKSILGIALTLQGLADSSSALKQFDQAQAFYGQSLPIFRQINSPTGESSVFESLMNYSRAQENRRLAIFYGKQSVNVIQKIRTSLSILETEVQKNFITSNENVYRSLAALLVEEGRLAEAQQVIALLKEDEYFQYTRRAARSTSEKTLSQIELNAEESIAAAKYQKLSERIIDLSKQLLNLQAQKNAVPSGETFPPEKIAEMQKINDELSQIGAAFTDFLKQTSLQFSRTDAPKPVALETTTTKNWQKKLAAAQDNAVLITLLVTEDKAYLILTTSGSQISRNLDIKASELNRKLFKFREILQDPRTAPLSAAQDLYRLLIAPIAEDLRKANAKTLLFSLDGALRYISFAALHDGEKFLIEDYAIATVTLAQVTEDIYSEPKKWRGLGAGVSQKISDFDALPNVADELKMVVRQNPKDKGLFPGRRLLNSAFTRSNLINELAQNFNLVHLASHFVLQPGKDIDSFLLLGDNDRLDLATIRNDAVFNFAAIDLLTLSACETAVAPYSNGEEIESFAVLAQKRGARSVMATLWSLADESPKVLLKDFYGIYQKQSGTVSKAEALRRAQLNLLKNSSQNSNDLRHPFYWSSFILLGQWK